MDDPDLEALTLDGDDDSDGQDQRLRRRQPLKKVPTGDLFEAARAGDLDRLRYLIESGVNVNARDPWDSVPLYYACLTGHLDSARLLLESGAICSEHTFDGDRCHYAALNLSVRKLLKLFEARPLPLAPLPSALRDTFLACSSNHHPLRSSETRCPGDSSSSSQYNPSHFPSDVTFFVQGRPIEAHRAILSARSPFLRRRFQTRWKDRKEVRLSGERLSYAALYSLIHFFYSDRLEILVDDIENLIQICKVCKCPSLQKVLEKEIILQKHAAYKALGDVDNSQKRFILQGLSLPEEDRLPAGLRRLLQISLASSLVQGPHGDERQGRDPEYDLADVCVKVGDKIFRCHQVILAARSEYFKARLSHLTDFIVSKNGLPAYALPVLEEHDLSSEAFGKMLKFMYTDDLKDIEPDQAEEIIDAASRYMLFPMKRAVADALLPYLESATPADLCRWLILSDMYGFFHRINCYAPIP